MDFNTIQSLQEAYNNVVEQTSTVASPGGAGGKVTVDKQYPATLGGKKGVKSTGPTGTEYFTPNFPGSSVPNRAEAKFKSVASQQYEKVPSDQRTMDLNKPVSVTDRTKYDPSYKPPGMKKENYEPDTFDIVLEYLVTEGYADTNKAALAIMANMSEEWRQDIMEISQKTATSAYASSKTGEFEGADSDRDVKRTDNLKKHIVRKFGKEAGEHADKAAESQTFGRKDASGRRKQTAKPRIEKSDYRTTKDGKMHKQDQRELKTELRIKRDRRLRAADKDTED